MTNERMTNDTLCPLCLVAVIRHPALVIRHSP